MTINTLTTAELDNLTLARADEVLQERQKEMAIIFEEAKSGDKYDFNQVKSLNGVKGSVAVAEYVGQLQSELNVVGEKRDILIAAEKAAKELGERSKARRDFALPGGGAVRGAGNYPDEGERFKSLGEMIVETKAFKNWIANGAGNGINIGIESALPSDILASAFAASTIGQKALMSLTAGFSNRAERLPGFVEAVTRPVQLLDIIPMGQTSKDSVVYMEETTRTHGAAGTAEGGTFAESAFAFTEKNSAVKKITDSVPVTDEQLEDQPFVQGYINGRLGPATRAGVHPACHAAVFRLVSFGARRDRREKGGRD